MLITDRLTITDKRRTADGYLVTEARFARNGLYEYSGREVGKPEMDRVIVYRPDDEVFNQDAMSSFAHKPVTNDHPSANVSAKTWKRDAVGFTDGRVARDGDFVVVPMMVTDEQAIADVEAGKAELSAGYTCDLDFVDGQLPNGQKYDAVMRNIRGNHVAIVDRGRAGSECRIGDSFGDGDFNMNLKKILVDGLQVETTDAGEAAIIKLQGQVADASRALAAAEADRDTKLADKDKELAAKDAQIDDLKTKVIDAATLDAKVAERAILVDRATKLVPTFDAKGKSDAEIKRAVVQAKCGDAAVTDRSDVYIDARFDTLVETLGSNNGVDTVRDTIMRGGPTGGSNVVHINPADAAADAEKALADANDLNGWRNKKPA
jgi:hypothetical protein